jgi:hypothetical protein
MINNEKIENRRARQLEKVKCSLRVRKRAFLTRMTFYAMV